MKKQVVKRGFTLIELLVVVLIIGILAAVAVPQYQKAVMKARLAQWDVMYNAGRKAIAAYLLENGVPSGGVAFTGKTRVGTIEMPGNCDIDNDRCYTSAGRLEAYCQSSRCGVAIYGNYNADGTSGNKTLGDDAYGYWVLSNDTGESWLIVTGKAGCQWASAHPDIPVDRASNITQCKDIYGVTLTNSYRRE